MKRFTTIFLFALLVPLVAQVQPTLAQDNALPTDTQQGIVWLQEQSKSQELSSFSKRQTPQTRAGANRLQQFQPKTTGLYVRGYVSGNGLSASGNTISGGGLGAKLGYGFSPLITGYLGLNSASMDAGNIAYFDIGAQVNFRSDESSLVPYADAALSGIGDDSGSSGAGITAGGGLKYFLLPSLALDGGLFLNVSSIESGSTVTGGRLNLGISWFPL